MLVSVKKKKKKKIPNRTYSSHLPESTLLKETSTTK